MTLHIALTPLRGFGQAGHDYEAVDTAGQVIAQGWVAGSTERTHHEATEHARRVLRERARRTAAAVTGER